MLETGILRLGPAHQSWFTNGFIIYQYFIISLIFVQNYRTHNLEALT